MRLLLDHIHFKLSLAFDKLSHLSFCALQSFNFLVKVVDLANLVPKLLSFEFRILNTPLLLL